MREKVNWLYIYWVIAVGIILSVMISDIKHELKEHRKFTYEALRGIQHNDSLQIDIIEKLTKLHK